MSHSVFLAWMIGPLMVLLGLTLLVNRMHYRAMVERFFTDPTDYYFSGLMSFLIGMAIVVTHNLWVADWRVLITLIGWSALIKGTLRLLFPTLGRRVFEAAFRTHNYLVLSGVVIIPFGLWLSWNAWAGS